MISRNPRHDQPMPPLRGAGCITVSFRPAIPRRPGRTSLTRGNVGGSHTPGKRTAETALAGCAERLQRTRLHRLNFLDPRENTGNSVERCLPSCTNSRVLREILEIDPRPPSRSCAPSYCSRGILNARGYAMPLLRAITTSPALLLQ